MIDREKILRYYRASGDDNLAAKLLDIAEAVAKNRKYKVSDFLDPYALSIAETIGNHFQLLRVQSDGGYLTAERVKAAFIHEDFLGTIDFELRALEFIWDRRYYSISHRDVLGAVIALGCKREVIGDILFTDQGCHVVTDVIIADFIIQQLKKIGSAVVTVREIDVKDLAHREEKVKEIRTTVASMRLDVIAAAGFGVSRSRMASEISAEKVKVNWQDAKNAAHSIKTGDIISMRGRGRIEVTDVLGQTKKGRFSIMLKRYI